jgi:hypothetical protein
VLVAPIAHRERMADDFSADDYLNLQAVIHPRSRWRSR